MKGRMVGKAMLTAKQKTLPKQLQEKIIKSKMEHRQVPLSGASPVFLPLYHI